MVRSYQERFSSLIERLGVVKVTEGGLFGHKETLDWHCNKLSNFRRHIIWICSKR